MIWDADFMLGLPGADGTDSYVVGEINVSSVFRSPTRRPQRLRAELPTVAVEAMNGPRADRDGQNRREPG
jgi:hypothetical protein